MPANCDWSLSPPASALLQSELAQIQLLTRLHSCCIPLSFSPLIKLKAVSGKDLTSLWCFMSDPGQSQNLLSF